MIQISSGLRDSCFKPCLLESGSKYNGHRAISWIFFLIFIYLTLWVLVVAGVWIAWALVVVPPGFSNCNVWAQ